jgi:hypothetical protein
VSLHVAAVFLAAALLFAVQPMSARALLPVLGGAPSVWNTCVVFFQTVLLAGYLYAHAGLARLGVARQAVLHCALLLALLPLLPPDGLAGSAPPDGASPSGWLLARLATSLGLPLLLVSSSAPLFQRWLHAGAGARNPYALYAASNAGSLAALLAYPTVIERWLGVEAQLRAWALGYAGLALLAIACALPLFGARGRSAEPAAAAPPQEQPGGDPPRREALSGARRLRWVALAFAPSSLLLGTTRFLATDVAVVPLLWIVPLALYLVSFVLAFARERPIGRAAGARLLPIAGVVWALAWCTEATEPVLAVLAIHLLTLFVGALVCHAELAADRPEARDLTGFYLAVAAGGALGGAFDALVAPLAFDEIVEYPLAIVLVCLLAPARGSGPRPRWSDVALAALPAAVAGGLLAASSLAGLEGPARRAATAGLPAILAYVLSDRPLRFALAIGGLVAVSGADASLRGAPLHVERSFFGVHRVTARPPTPSSAPLHELYHGTTLHGAQRADPATGSPAAPDEPLVYYHRAGPVGELFAAKGPEIARVGVVGLGAGALAAYTGRGRDATFFEIDPAVARIAEDGRFFSHVAAARARGAEVRIELGDARRALGASDARFDLLVLDAFGSDAIPVHLLTREAFALYAERLAPRGVIACNVSSRSLDLEPVLAAVVAEGGLAGWIRRDTGVSPEESARSGRHPSEWVAIARARADLAPLLAGGRWQPLARGAATAWTDDRADLLAALRWGGGEPAQRGWMPSLRR